MATNGYQRRVRDDELQVRQRLRTLAAERPRWGYRRLHVLLKVLLKRELGAIDLKRVQRLYRLEGLAIRRQKRKAGDVRPPWGRRRCVAARGSLCHGLHASSLGRMCEPMRGASAHCMCVMNVLDTVTPVTRAWLAIEADTSLPGQRVVRLLLLDQLILWHGRPGALKRIALDNGTEFAGQALDAWRSHHQVTLDFIDPGKPMQDGYLESYNIERKHSALCGHPPAEHALYYQAAGSLA